jgi:periplasmic copper chaperone A
LIALIAAAMITVTGLTVHPAFESAAVYATIHNKDGLADAIDGVQTPLGTATMRMSSASTDESDPQNAIPVAEIAVPALGTVRLKPGGYHIVISLKRPLHVGDRISLRLHFQREGWVATSCTVKHW